MDSQPTSNEDQDKNCLFIKWLNEWRIKAKENGSKLEFVYAKALKSLKEHPEALKSGTECKKLKGFGEKICTQIDNKLAQHYGRPGVLLKDKTTLSRKSPIRSIASVFPVRKRVCSPKVEGTLPNKITRHQRYIPGQGTSSFAILVALLRLELEFANNRVNKLDLQEMAQLYTKNLLVGNQGNHSGFGGWQSIKTLLKRDLVLKTSDRSPYYYLSEDGKKLAKNLALACPSLQDFSNRYVKGITALTNSQDQNGLDGSEESSQQTVSRKFVLEAGHYEIVLCIDSRERISTGQIAQSRTAFATALQKHGILVDIRTLPLGDFVWVAREKKTSDTETLPNGFQSQFSNEKTVQRELVLDHIIERKRIDDLASSIKDRRWNEQKFRLKNCGLRHPIYLIEFLGKQSKKIHDIGGIKLESLEQAISNCQIDGFEVKRTDNFDESICYLTFMTRWLKEFYSKKSIMSCPSKEDLAKTTANDLCYLTFNEFAYTSKKCRTFTNREMFVKHLLQIRGVSFDKVQAIIKQYPTFRSMMRAYALIEDDDAKSKHNLLADLKMENFNGNGGGQRRLGPALSKKISMFYNR